jgi:hypothetical protein
MAPASDRGICQNFAAIAGGMVNTIAAAMLSMRASSAKKGWMSGRVPSRKPRNKKFI